MNTYLQTLDGFNPGEKGSTRGDPHVLPDSSFWFTEQEQGAEAESFGPAK